MTAQSITHYRIIKKLGAGGMGEVYLAEDTKLDRKVAIKFLTPESTADEHAKKRLIREAKAAAKLDHPNICSIYEVGEEADQSFIAMQYVEGETLASRMHRRPLELRETMGIATQTADALAEAHSQGIIHRDIKPQNIMITSRNQAKVMDFGLAKVVRQAAFESEAETESVLTDPGVIVGTVPYMSPEQVNGGAYDVRSDIFSFGAVMYEMITGHQPFAAESAAATISAILTREPPPLARYSNEVPGELQRIITKAICKDRERRYQSMRDLALDLDNCRRECESARAIASAGELKTRGEAITTASDEKLHGFLRSRRALIASAALVLMIGVGLAFVLTFRKTTTARPPEIRSLAVLPLENLSGDPEQEYFADGMTEALISNLAQISALNRVISRTSVMRYKGSHKSLPEIAQELNVDAVIEGSVRRSGGRVLVTAKLIPAATDSPVWTREYERDLSDVLKLESEVARALADEIRIQVTTEEHARLASARSVNPQAHDAYLLGRSHIKRNEDDLKQAIQYFERSIQLVPDYAPAHAGLSDAWLQRGIWGAKHFREVESRARAAALKAVELDPQLAEAHAP